MKNYFNCSLHYIYFCKKLQFDLDSNCLERQLKNQIAANKIVLHKHLATLYYFMNRL